VWLLLFALAPLLLFVLGRNLRNLLRTSAVLASILLLTGCGGATTADGRVERDLESKLFRSVQVWGRRGTGAGEFNKPRSLALDRDDNLYVVDITGRVQKFSPDGAYLLSWQMPQTDKGKPKGMDRDSDGNIIVVEPHYSRVNHFDPTGKLLTQWGITGTNRGELIFPRSVAVNSHGDLFLSEYGLAERIQHFSARGERFIDSFGVPGNGPGDLNRAEGIGFDSQDHLFVADSCNHRVQVFSADGKYITAFGTPGSGPGEMSYPYDVRIDRAGNRFVCEFGNSRVQIFDAQNKALEILGGAGAEPGQMNNPWAIAFDSRGDLYVADSLNHRIQKFIRREPFTPAQTFHSTAEKPLAAN
jgi:DNA-binding beta-propeller fold protein YncE